MSSIFVKRKMSATHQMLGIDCLRVKLLAHIIISSLECYAVIRVDLEGSCYMRGRYTIAILTVAGALACPITMAEVGDRYEESVKKHGEPMGKLVMKDQVAYMFSSKNLLVREVYNTEGICIESGFLSSVKLTEKSILPTAIPAEAIESASWSKWWFLLLLFPVSGLVGTSVWCIFLRKRKKPFSEGASTETMPGPVISEPSTSAVPSESSLRLSRNEMCFYRALSEAVQGQYIVTFHLLLEQIIDFDHPDFSEYIPAFNEQKPVSVDFVLHHTEDSSVSAVILLTDGKSTQDQKIDRAKFIQQVLQKNKTPIIQVHENYQYDSNKVMTLIQNATRKSAA